MLQGKFKLDFSWSPMFGLSCNLIPTNIHDSAPCCNFVHLIATALDLKMLLDLHSALNFCTVQCLLELKASEMKHRINLENVASAGPSPPPLPGSSTVSPTNVLHRDHQHLHIHCTPALKGHREYDLGVQFSELSHCFSLQRFLVHPHSTQNYTTILIYDREEN